MDNKDLMNQIINQVIDDAKHYNQEAKTFMKQKAWTQAERSIAKADYAIWLTKQLKRKRDNL